MTEPEPTSCRFASTGFVVCLACIAVIVIVLHVLVLGLFAPRVRSGHPIEVTRGNIYPIESAIMLYTDDHGAWPLPAQDGSRPHVREVIDVLTASPVRSHPRQMYLSPGRDADGDLHLDAWGNTILVEFYKVQYQDDAGHPAALLCHRVWSPGPSGLDEDCLGDDVVGVHAAMWRRSHDQRNPGVREVPAGGRGADERKALASEPGRDMIA